jgi:Golgi SNAP receptor complex protein 2
MSESLPALLPTEKRRLTQIEQSIIALERGDTAISIADVTSELHSVSSRITYLDQLVLRESKAQKEEYRGRVKHLRILYDHAKSGLDKYISKKNKKSSPYLSQQEQLFQGSVDPSQARDFDGVEREEAQSLNRTTSMVQEHIASARGSLEELVNQKDRLKTVQRKVLDIMGYLGLSDTIMKNANRREVVDKIIVYGGMLFIIVLLFVVYKYFS